MSPSCPGCGGGSPRWRHAALQSRLALALAIATSLALVLAHRVVTAQEEQLAVEQIWPSAHRGQAIARTSPITSR